MSTKVRGVLRKQGGVAAGDKIAIAVSRGKSSACLLYLMKYLRSDPREARQRYKIPFDFVTITVAENEKIDYSKYLEDFKRTHEVSTHSVDVPLCHVFATKDQLSGDEWDKLQKLLSLVRDKTGRQDLIHHLKRYLILNTATAYGCSKVLLGQTANMMAAEAVSAAAKGQGYALPSNAQAVDDRYGSKFPSILHPMKDISDEEVYCLSSTILQDVIHENEQEPQHLDKNDINDLAKSFISLVQNSNPGGVSNIMSSISKLEPFDWCHDDGNTSSDSSLKLCTLCFAPLHECDKVEMSSIHASPINSTCLCCREGIFGCIRPDDVNSDSARDIFQHLPSPLQARMSRCID